MGLRRHSYPRLLNSYGRPTASRSHQSSSGPMPNETTKCRLRVRVITSHCVIITPAFNPRAMLSVPSLFRRTSPKPEYPAHDYGPDKSPTTRIESAKRERTRDCYERRARVDDCVTRCKDWQSTKDANVVLRRVAKVVLIYQQSSQRWVSIA